jgi:hypothetical protein
MHGYDRHYRSFFGGFRKLGYVEGHNLIFGPYLASLPATWCSTKRVRGEVARTCGRNRSQRCTGTIRTPAAHIGACREGSAPGNLREA